ncbi:MAG TPA: ribosomal-protein-alanine N-acetyltransferase, partial [Alphaproteobacteria bacterium]|nr:ribosomal-protein-alanine N-acetyltransferase [Alphaproteobacteria bacterium]
MKAELSRATSERPEPLVIAPMLHGDISEVLAIERASFVTTWPADAFYNELHTNKLAHYYVGRIG